MTMDIGSWAATAGDGATNFTPANILLDFQNASSPTTQWDNNQVTRLENQQRLIHEQVYRDFTTTIQVLILIGSLIGKHQRCCCSCSWG